jgi:hypothetical protein
MAVYYRHLKRKRPETHHFYFQEGTMPWLRGILLGLGLSFTGTIVYLVWTIRAFSKLTPAPPPGVVGEVGWDVGSLGRGLMLENYGYWAFILVLVALGCCIAFLFQKPIPA